MLPLAQRPVLDAAGVDVYERRVEPRVVPVRVGLREDESGPHLESGGV